MCGSEKKPKASKMKLQSIQRVAVSGMSKKSRRGYCNQKGGWAVLMGEMGLRQGGARFAAVPFSHTLSSSCLPPRFQRTKFFFFILCIARGHWHVRNTGV